MSKSKEAMVIIKGSQGRKASEVHQGNLHLQGTKVHFLVIVILVQTLVTWKKTVKHIIKCYGPQPSHRDRCYSLSQPPRNNFAGRNHEFLFMNNVECFKCHNIGHMAHDCNLTWALTQARTMQKKKVTQIWRRTEIQSKSPLSSSVNSIFHWPNFLQSQH